MKLFVGKKGASVWQESLHVGLLQSRWIDWSLSSAVPPPASLHSIWKSIIHVHFMATVGQRKAPVQSSRVFCTMQLEPDVSQSAALCTARRVEHASSFSQPFQSWMQKFLDSTGVKKTTTQTRPRRTRKPNWKSRKLLHTLKLKEEGGSIGDGKYPVYANRWWSWWSWWSEVNLVSSCSAEHPANYGPGPFTDR